MNPSIFDRLFILSVKNRSRIIFYFKIFYLFLLTWLFLAIRSTYSFDAHALFYYTAAISCGQVGIVVYMLTTIPGITRRFGISHRLIQILMMFRRYIGITMFLLVSIHFFVVKGVDIFFKGIIQIPPPLFQIASSFAYIMLFFMFVTSNDFSTKRLGSWWQKIHNLTYIIVWLIFIHVALQRLSIWTVLIGLTAIAQISSHLYFNYKKRQLLTVPTVTKS